MGGLSSVKNHSFVAGSFVCGMILFHGRLHVPLATAARVSSASSRGAKSTKRGWVPTYLLRGTFFGVDNIWPHLRPVKQKLRVKYLLCFLEVRVEGALVTKVMKHGYKQLRRLLHRKEMVGVWEGEIPQQKCCWNAAGSRTTCLEAHSKSFTSLHVSVRLCHDSGCFFGTLPSLMDEYVLM